MAARQEIRGTVIDGYWHGSSHARQPWSWRIVVQLDDGTELEGNAPGDSEQSSGPIALVATVCGHRFLRAKAI